MELLLFEKKHFRNNAISNIHLMSDSEKNQKSNLIFLNLQKLMNSASMMDSFSTVIDQERKERNRRGQRERTERNEG